MSCSVVFTPEAEKQIAAQYLYIARVASPSVALRYTEAVISYCESLCTFPLRGSMRERHRQTRAPDATALHTHARHDADAADQLHLVAITLVAVCARSMAESGYFYQKFWHGFG